MTYPPPTAPPIRHSGFEAPSAIHPYPCLSGHSSQRLDPGLNVALYTNIAVDNLLESARGTTDATVRTKKYEKFQNEVISDIPAIFLYSPDFIYVTSKDIKGSQISNITIPSERFFDVYLWHIYTDNVWRIFAK